MPLYEYLCQSCQERTEVIRKFSDPPLTECPQCGGALKKLVSSPAIQFKGSGFYITDYARAGGSGEKGGEGGASKSDGGSSPDSGTTKAGSEGGGSKKSGGTE